MGRIRFDRLEQIADHLESGKLMHKEFYFSSYNEGTVGLNGCGTAGCAVGEFPAIWPYDWFFDNENSYMLTLINGNNKHTTDSIEEWLGLECAERVHLFIPLCQDTRRFGGKFLPGTATKEEVAKNIRAFINRKKHQHENSNS